MKYYNLSAVINGDPVKLKRTMFSSRDDAIEYMFDYYDKHYLYSLRVNDTHPVDDNKHKIEYVCDFYNRFVISRETI